MLDRPLVFLDVETTGSSSSIDRVTEIGLIEVDCGEYVREWSTLVNPQMPISPFIEALTGISNAMVADAPAFAEIAGELKSRLAGRMLVAHNAHFDYGFLRAEFARIDAEYTTELICTVKLSRKLFPGERRHNLDSLIERHAVNCEARHRALGDARVLWDLLSKWRIDPGADAVTQAAAAQLNKAKQRKTPAVRAAA